MNNWLDSWTKHRKMPATMRAAQRYATRSGHAADAANKPPAGAPWQEVVKWLRGGGRRASGQEGPQK